MKHPEPEELVLYYYREGQTAHTAQHLEECAECSAEFERIRLSLTAVSAPLEPELPSDYGQRVWASISPRLEPAKSAPWRAWLSPRYWAPIAVTAALLVVAFLGGMQWQRRNYPTPVNVATTADPKADAQARERVLLSAVGDHLENSQRMLVELMLAPGERAADLTQEQRRAGQLVAANRLYRHSAQSAGETAVAELLDQLERVLVELANGPDQLSAAELERMRNRIEAQNLLFKVRVLKNNVQDRAPAAKPATADTQQL